MDEYILNHVAICFSTYVTPLHFAFTDLLRNPSKTIDLLFFKKIPIQVNSNCSSYNLIKRIFVTIVFATNYNNLLFISILIYSLFHYFNRFVISLNNEFQYFNRYRIIIYYLFHYFNSFTVTFMEIKPMCCGKSVQFFHRYFVKQTYLLISFQLPMQTMWNVKCCKSVIVYVYSFLFLFAKIMRVQFILVSWVNKKIVKKNCT